MTTSASLFDEAWLSLNQAGRLLDRDAFDELPEPSAPRYGLAERLRDALAQAPTDPRGEVFGALLDAVLEDACGLVVGWRKGSDVPANYAEGLLDGTTLKPRRIYEHEGHAALSVFVSTATRIGLHKGRRDTAHVVEWLRKKRSPLGLVTNGREWRLIYADVDNTAFVEWTSDRLVEGDTLSPALHVLRRVLAPTALESEGEAQPAPLIAAIRRARLGQARLSKELGERVRGAVELLLSARRAVIEPHWTADESKDIYNAACHFVMRLVVVFFAEARELLPVDSVVYHDGYGLKGLLASLERAGKHRRETRQQAWPRLLALFRLLHRGSLHPALMVPTYGGDLFRPGEALSNAQERALHRIEAIAESPNDEVIYRMLTLLTRTTERVKEGGAFRTVAAPVDFTELTSEYIGILYEGLLDYELHRAGEQPVVFLGIGDQPALPLDRLEAMSDKQLQALVEKAKVKVGAADEEAPEESDDASEEPEDEEENAEAPLAAPPDDEPVELDDTRGEALRRALAWAEKAAIAAKLVKVPKKKDDPKHRAEVEKASKQLIARVMLPGELYVVRWGGTRKGAGTFYTRPQLTMPTVRRTLEPLITNADGTLKTPEEILSLKVCDPAMGSGSFLVAALRVLSEAVIASLHQHKRLVARDGSDLIHIDCALLPSADQDQSAEGVAAIVRRAVVEHCLYGVDLDPLAVELGRVSLWVETLDKRLPFTFLDHKLRPGNALVGTWLDRFRDYPLLAWWRQSPDEKWRGVTHDSDLWANQLKALRSSIVDEQRKLIAGEAKLNFAGESDDALKAAIERVRKLYRELREVPASQPDKRADIWKKRIATSPELAKVKEAFDTWCALWFWPLDRLDLAPRPLDLLSPSAAARAIVREVAAKKENRFFHWELEFPDVFTEKGAGFDAVVANPPWEIRKPSSKEFFSDRDPLYRSYAKQDALRWQREEFQRDAGFERKWLDHNGLFKDSGNFVRHAAEPFGNTEDASVALVPRKAKESASAHKKWSAERSKKTGLSDPEHAFRHQGSADLNSYKLFVEQAHALLRTGGQLGLITPSGLYTDKGAVDLRTLLLDRCAWRWLYGFENRNKVFDIDSRFKFAVTIAQKNGAAGGGTQALQAAFMRRDLSDWAEAKGVLSYPAERIHSFSPKSLAFVEVRSTLDLDVLTRIQKAGVGLGGCVEFTQQFDMTTDSKLFPPLPDWERKGFVATSEGWWREPTGQVALPIYEGRMVGQFDPSEKRWVAGKGRTAEWAMVPWEQKTIGPQYLIAEKDYSLSDKRVGGPAFYYMKISSATNTRTMIGTVLYDQPSVYSLCLLRQPSFDLADWMGLSAILNSYCFDFVIRQRLGGLNITGYVLSDLPVISSGPWTHNVAPAVAALSLPHRRYALMWLDLRNVLIATNTRFRPIVAITAHERLRLRSILDAIVAALYGLTRDDLRWILRDCDHPKEQATNRDFASKLDPKGFWRVDKEVDPELRHTVLTLVAFDALVALVAEHGGDRDSGIAAFSALNDGEGWMIPETLRLKDHDLGHDAPHAEAPQPVASRLGPRFLDWQLAQTPEESWAECEKHARAILGDAAFEARFGKDAKPKTTTLEGRMSVRPAIKGTVEVKPAQPQLSLFDPTADVGRELRKQQERLDRILDPFNTFRKEQERLERALDPFKQMLELQDKLLRVTEPLKGFREQQERLDRILDPLKGFREQQERLDRIGDPFKGLREQQERLERALDPLKKMHEQQERLTQALAPLLEAAPSEQLRRAVERAATALSSAEAALLQPLQAALQQGPMPMTISNIRLKNFRNWTTEHWDSGVVLRPITLVLGRNSAGKTSILQPLRLLKQTIETTDAGTHVLLDGTKVDGVNLGAFSDIVHDNDEKEAVGIGIDVLEKGLSVDVTFRQVNERPVIESLTYRIRDEKLEVTRSANAAYQLQSPRFRLPNWDGDKDVQQPKKGYEPGRAVELFDAALTDLGPILGPIVRNAIVGVKDAFAAFHYLGPLRPPPAREVTWSQQDPTRLGSNGSETIQALISNETGASKGALRASVSEWLKRLDLADGIEISRVGKTLLYQINVVRGRKRSNLADVGYGVSQVLPVITLLFFAPEGSVILCEDPEAHLHPMAQAALADLFVEVAKKRNLQVLIETHSEHLFRRLQYLIAAGNVRAEDCALYYVERDEPSAKLTTLSTNEFGQISNWPDRFFGDAMGETERQVKKIIERKRAPKDGQRG